MIALTFYVFAFILVACAVMVVTSRNPVHSVLALIACFFNASGLFLLAGAEFLAMILVIVYVGAVAVLFLFVVMMLDINFTELRQGFLQYLPVGALIGLILFTELVLVLGSWTILPGASTAITAPVAAAGGVAASNTHALGQLIYTHYAYPFQVAGLILLVAMIGAIVLTLRQRTGVRRQSIAAQIARTRATAIEVRQVKPGQGI